MATVTSTMPHRIGARLRSLTQLFTSFITLMALLQINAGSLGEPFCLDDEAEARANGHQHRGARWRDGHTRGMVTAEYAVGILAAVALALVLLKVFQNSQFLQAMLNLVKSILAKVAGMF